MTTPPSEAISASAHLALPCRFLWLVGWTGSRGDADVHAVHVGMTAMVPYQHRGRNAGAFVSIYLGYCGCIRRHGRRGFLTLAERVNPGCIGNHAAGPPCWSRQSEAKSADGQSGAAWHSDGSLAPRVQARSHSDRIEAGEPLMQPRRHVAFGC